MCLFNNVDAIWDDHTQVFPTGCYWGSLSKPQCHDYAIIYSVSTIEQGIVHNTKHIWVTKKKKTQNTKMNIWFKLPCLLNTLPNIPLPQVNCWHEREQTFIMALLTRLQVANQGCPTVSVSLCFLFAAVACSCWGSWFPFLWRGGWCYWWGELCIFGPWIIFKVWDYNILNA